MQFLVQHGAADLGYVDPIALTASRDQQSLILLSGHSWRVTSVDWSKRLVWVEPAPGEGKARWFGSSRSVGFDLCQAIKRVLCNGEVGVVLSKRGVEKLSGLQAELPSLDPDGTTIEQLAAGQVRWWTFAGGRTNWLLAYVEGGTRRGLHSDDFRIDYKSNLALSGLSERLRILNRSELSKMLIAMNVLDIKFMEAVPVELLAREALVRGVDWKRAELILQQAPVFRTERA
jgi:ATP-dependent Lhr-like helicase